MKFLADAHISRGMVAYLQGLGHDVVHAEVLQPRLSDSAILNLAYNQQRIVLTADKDFGELVFRQRQRCAGLVLLRLSIASEKHRLEVFERLWPIIEQNAGGHFVVVTETTVRRTALPMNL